MKLYELTANYKEVLDMMNTVPDESSEAGEEQRKVFTDTLDAIKDDMKVKVDNITRFIANKEADIDGYDKEIKRLTALKKSTEQKIEWLKDYTMYQLEIAKIKKLETGTFVVSIRNSKSVQITDAKQLPDKFIHKTLTEKPDKKLIKDALKIGENVPGAVLAENHSLNIR